MIVTRECAGGCGANLTPENMYWYGDDPYCIDCVSDKDDGDEPEEEVTDV